MESIRARCRSLLSPYKVPRRILVWTGTSLPANASGKVLKGELQRMVAATKSRL